MPRWLGVVLQMIHACARTSTVRVTYKALLEMAEFEPEVSLEDALQLLAGLGHRDFRYRVRSERTGEWLYIFRASWCGERVYLKVLLRAECTLVSFHPEATEHEVEEDEDAPG